MISSHFYCNPSQLLGLQLNWNLDSLWFCFWKMAGLYRNSLEKPSLILEDTFFPCKLCVELWYYFDFICDRVLYIQTEYFFPSFHHLTLWWSLELQILENEETSPTLCKKNLLWDSSLMWYCSGYGMIAWVSFCGTAGTEVRNQPFSITLGVASLRRSSRVSLIYIGYE